MAGNLTINPEQQSQTHCKRISRLRADRSCHLLSASPLLIKEREKKGINKAYKRKNGYTYAFHNYNAKVWRITFPVAYMCFISKNVRTLHVDMCETEINVRENGHRNVQDFLVLQAAFRLGIFQFAP